MKRLSLQLVVAVGLWLLAPLGSARADSFVGYVCRVQVDGTTGSYSFALYSAPACSGTFRGTFYIRTQLFSGDTAVYHGMLPLIVSAAASQMRVSGTHTPTTLLGWVSNQVDTLVFNGD